MQGTTNLGTLRVGLAERMHDYFTGVTTSVVAASCADVHQRNSLIDTEGLTEGDNWWSQGWVRITGELVNSNNIGLIKRIRSYTQASQMMRVWGTFPQTLGCSAAYELYRLIEPTYYPKALNEASRKCYPQIYRYIEDETLTVESNTYTYTVPSLMRQVVQVWYEANETESTYPYIEMQGCTVTEGGKLRLSGLPPIGRKLRLIGMCGLTNNLSSDSDLIEVDEERLEPLYWAAEEYLWGYLAKTSSVADAERYEQHRRWAYGQWRQSLTQKAMEYPTIKIDSEPLGSWT